MKNLTMKKIVICSIGVIGALLLFIGLAFNVLAYDMLGLGGAAGGAVSDTLGWKANGFTMLSFKFPAGLIGAMTTFVAVDFMELYGVLFGVSSLLTLLVSIAALALIILAFFRFASPKCYKIVLWLLIVGVVISLVHSVLAIVFSSIVQGNMDKFYKALSEQLGTEQASVGTFGSNAFISAIFQAVCLIGAIVCVKVIPEKTVSTEVKAETEKPNAREHDVKKEDVLQGILGAERTLAQLLNEYKALYDAAILSTADYVDKKVKILHYSERRFVGVAALVDKCSFEGVVKAESTVVELLKEYKELLEKGVISDADFVSKKVALLNYIIN